MTQAELARHLGLSSAAVSKCKRAGMPVHDLEAARRWRAAHVAPYTRAAAPARPAPAAVPAVASAPAAVAPPAAAPGGDVADLATERARLARSQREAQDMKNAILRGQYAPIGYLSEVLAAVAAEFGQQLEALPADVRRRCPTLPAEALDALAAAIAAGRNAMADALEAAGARAAATAHCPPPDQTDEVPA